MRGPHALSYKEEGFDLSATLMTKVIRNSYHLQVRFCLGYVARQYPPFSWELLRPRVHGLHSILSHFVPLAKTFPVGPHLSHYPDTISLLMIIVPMIPRYNINLLQLGFWGRIALILNIGAPYRVRIRTRRATAGKLSVPILFAIDSEPQFRKR